MFRIGQLLDQKYEIKEIIGSGGGGVVYKAYQHGLGRDVAIKKIKDNIIGKIDEQGEANILKKLKNNYIPTVYDFINEDGNMYTVMEFIEGVSFQQLLDEGRRFTQKEVVKYATQLCTAVEYLHSRTPVIVHSDIKPANIMLTDEGNICLIDFNVSLIIDGNANAIGISEGYSPPEQYGGIFSVKPAKPNAKDRTRTLVDSKSKTPGVPATDTDTKMDTVIDNGITETEALIPKTNPVKTNGETLMTEMDLTEELLKPPAVDSSLKISPHIDERSDIYAMGATLYHLLTGKRPAPSRESVTPVQQCGVAVTEGFAQVINKAMEKSPENRFSNAKQLENAIKNLHKNDLRYKKLALQHELTTIAIVCMMALSLLLIFAGYIRKTDEMTKAYSEYIERLYASTVSENEADINDLYVAATKLEPERAEAYEIMAYYLFNNEKYAEASEFINSNIVGHELYISENNTPYGNSNIYYILGRCLMETDNNSAASEAFASALSLENTDIAYYRDYAVSLARCGKTDEAESVLNDAKANGLNSTDILFADGEIKYALKKYTESIECFSSCIDSTNDAALKYRAYMVCANAYDEAYRLNQISNSERMEFLQTAVKDVPVDKAMAIYEMLAQAYIDEGQVTGNTHYYKEAVSVLENMRSFGWTSDTTDQTMIRLYHNLGEYEYAIELAEKSISENGENYILYKLMAFAESEIQYGKEKKDRDYTKFEGYYNHAKQLCDDSEDFEMQLLDEAYQKIKNN